MTNYLNNSRRIVIKIGSLLMADAEHCTLRDAWLASVAEDIAALRRLGKEIVIVSSGAVTLGRRVISLPHVELKLEEKQAAAACGQLLLVEGWQRALSTHSIAVAQILLTASDMENRRRYLNARSTLNVLLSHGIVPIINENDTVTTAEIRYGDNDRLAASVAAMLSADALILLSTIDGLYTADPRTDSAAKHISEIMEITEEIEAMAGSSADAFATGGMRTKIMAAQLANAAGCHMAIADGRQLHPLQALLDGAKSSWFVASNTPLTARKQWIAGSVHPSGAVVVDDGAKKALQKGGSLLPAGVTAIEGTFIRGDTILIKDKNGVLIGRGLAVYRSRDALKIMGKKSEDIASILGYYRRDELIHRDDMVLEG